MSRRIPRKRGKSRCAAPPTAWRARIAAMPSPRSTPCNAKPSSRRAKRISEIGKRIYARSSKTRTADMALDQIYKKLEGKLTGALEGRHGAAEGLVEALGATPMAVDVRRGVY